MKNFYPRNSLRNYINNYIHRKSLRNVLAERDEHQISALEKDIGVEKGHLKKEAYKFFWED